MKEYYISVKVFYTEQKIGGGYQPPVYDITKIIGTYERKTIRREKFPPYVIKYYVFSCSFLIFIQANASYISATPIKETPLPI